MHSGKLSSASIPLPPSYLHVFLTLAHRQIKRAWTCLVVMRSPRLRWRSFEFGANGAAAFLIPGIPCYVSFARLQPRVLVRPYYPSNTAQSLIARQDQLQD